MAQDDIQGQVVDAQGNPVSGAIVELTKSYQSNPVEGGDVFRTTTDNNGNYIFTEHQEGDGTTQEWHVSAYNYDGTAYVNSFNNPGVTADLPSAIPDSLAHRYLFEQDLTDSVDGSDGTEISSVSYSSNSKEGSFSVSSNGSNSEATFGNIFNETDFSIVCWINASTVTTKPRILTDEKLQFGISGNFAGNKISFTVRGSSNFNRIQAFTPDTNEWYHVACIYSASAPLQQVLYVNGNLEASANPSITPSTDSTELTLFGSSGESVYDGLVDSLDLYSKRLTGTEVANHFNTGSIDG